MFYAFLERCAQGLMWLALLWGVGLLISLPFQLLALLT